MCKEKLGNITCPTCKYIRFSDPNDVEYYHCDKCDCCVEGFVEFKTHCDGCDKCISKKNFDSHECIK